VQSFIKNKSTQRGKSLALVRLKSHNPLRNQIAWAGNSLMVGLSGLEKFSHLEDKIYRTIELTKTLRQEKESLEKELSLMRRNRGGGSFEQQRLEKQVEALLAERDIIRAKVEAMLDAVAALDPEMAEELR
jgi:hypothetical protein